MRVAFSSATLAKKDGKMQDLTANSRVSFRGNVVHHIYPKLHYLSKFDLGDGSVSVLVRLHMVKVEDSLYTLGVWRVSPSFRMWWEDPSLFVGRGEKS